MSADKTRVHFKAPSLLINRVDALGAVLNKNRTELLIEALTQYIDEQIETDQADRLIGAAYYDDQLSDDQLKKLVGLKEAHGYIHLKQNLEREPRTLPDPADSDTEVYPDDFESTMIPGQDN